MSPMAAAASPPAQPKPDPKARVATAGGSFLALFVVAAGLMLVIRLFNAERYAGSNRDSGFYTTYVEPDDFAQVGPARYACGVCDA